MNQYRIVIAEDDADLREALVRHFRAQGFAVFAAANGQAGVERVRQVRPHLIVLDLRMPVMDGEAMMTQLRKQQPDIVHTPLLVLTNLSASLPASSILRRHTTMRTMVKSNVGLDEIVAIARELLPTAPIADTVEVTHDRQTSFDH